MGGGCGGGVEGWGGGVGGVGCVEGGGGEEGGGFGGGEEVGPEVWGGGVVGMLVGVSCFCCGGGKWGEFGTVEWTLPNPSTPSCSRQSHVHHDSSLFPELPGPQQYYVHPRLRYNPHQNPAQQKYPLTIIIRHHHLPPQRLPRPNSNNRLRPLQPLKPLRQPLLSPPSHFLLNDTEHGNDIAETAAQPNQPVRQPICI